jgi:hypothetical protein
MISLILMPPTAQRDAPTTCRSNWPGWELLTHHHHNFHTGQSTSCHFIILLPPPPLLRAGRCSDSISSRAVRREGLLLHRGILTLGWQAILQPCISQSPSSATPSSASSSWNPCRVVSCVYQGHPVELSTFKVAISRHELP